MANKQRYARLSRMIRDWQGGNGTFSWLIGGPVRRLNPWAQSAKRDLERGRRCDMIQAYFSPSRGMLRRIGQVGMRGQVRSEEHTSELQSLMRISYAVLCLKQTKQLRPQICRHRTIIKHTHNNI